MDVDVTSTNGAAGVVAYNVCSTAPVETIDRVLESAESVALQALASAEKTPMKLSAESSGGAAGAFSAVNIYDPTSHNRSGSDLKAYSFLNLAPRPPRQLVMRVEQCQQLIEALTSEDAGNVGVSSEAALHGVGGYGKTTIAKIVCYMPQVTSFFKGGIVWISLSENPAPVDVKLSDVLEATGAEVVNFSDLHLLKAHIRKSLEDRRKVLGPVLVVFDDVWNWDDFEPYLDPFYCCTRLITTRSIGVSGMLDKRVLVDVMTSFESVELLTQGIDRTKLCPATDELLVQLSDRLFHWPLLLSIANRIIQRKRILLKSRNIVKAIEIIHQEMDKGMCALDTAKYKARETSVEYCISASTNQLNSDEKRYFEMMAVFPEDTNIPVTVLGKLWGLSEREADELVEKLVETGLVQMCNSSSESQCFVSLHDVIRSYLISKSRLNLINLHTHLLQCYRPDCSHWWEMEEQYMYQLLEYHLKEAGCKQELDTLRKDIRWYLAKCSSVGFLDLSDRIIAHSLAQALYERDRNELLRIVHQQLQSKMWTEAAIDLLLESVLRFLITDSHKTDFSDFDFMNAVGLTQSYERLIQKYGQRIPYLVDCDKSRNLSQADVMRLVNISVNSNRLSAARGHAVSTLVRGYGMCGTAGERDCYLALLINCCLDRGSIADNRLRISSILSSFEPAADVFIQLVGRLTDHWQEGRYRAFVELFSDLFNASHYDIAIYYLPKLQDSFSEFYFDAIVQCLIYTVSNSQDIDAEYMLDKVADVNFPKCRKLMNRLICYVFHIGFVQQRTCCLNVCAKWLNQLNPLFVRSVRLTLPEVADKLLLLVHEDNDSNQLTNALHVMKSLTRVPGVSFALCEILGTFVLEPDQRRNDQVLPSFIAESSCQDSTNTRFRSVLEYSLETGDVYSFSSLLNMWPPSSKLLRIVLRHLSAVNFRGTASRPIVSGTDFVVVIEAILREPQQSDYDRLADLRQGGVSVCELLHDLLFDCDVGIFSETLTDLFWRKTRTVLKDCFEWIIKECQRKRGEHQQVWVEVFDSLSILICSLLTCSSHASIYSRLWKTNSKVPHCEGWFRICNQGDEVESKFVCQVSYSWPEDKAALPSFLIQCLALSPVYSICEAILFLAFRSDARLLYSISDFCNSCRDVLNLFNPRQRCLLSMRICALRELTTLSYQSLSWTPVGSSLSLTEAAIFLLQEETEDDILSGAAAQLVVTVLDSYTHGFLKLQDDAMPLVDSMLREEICRSPQRAWLRLFVSMHSELAPNSPFLTDEVNKAIRKRLSGVIDTLNITEILTLVQFINLMYLLSRYQYNLAKDLMASVRQLTGFSSNQSIWSLRKCLSFMTLDEVKYRLLSNEWYTDLDFDMLKSTFIVPVFSSPFY